eukprot:TRINITY_DN50484_c0_g2_i1.p1 TRINITY_DN50484_c0_g2~~TRINITY_DN50484_c0_g2_i1.p1  ORF type:complete len:239 (+),score=49.81 TRINITY_DN50484_c0_g2_i1:245-961(+)
MRIVVFGSGSKETPDLFLQEAEKLGRLLAKAGHVCINGAGKFGSMGALNRGCMAEGGALEGSIHKMWTKEGDVDEQQEGMMTLRMCDGPTLAGRKWLMNETADAFMVLPGGPGTMDEAWEVICERQIGMPLGLLPRPVVFVNLGGYWEPSMAQLQKAQEHKLLYCPIDQIVGLEPDAQSALRYIEDQVTLIKAGKAGTAQKTDENRAGETTQKIRDPCLVAALSVGLFVLGRVSRYVL